MSRKARTESVERIRWAGVLSPASRLFGNVLFELWSWWPDTLLWPWSSLDDGERGGYVEAILQKGQDDEGGDGAIVGVVIVTLCC